MTKEDDDLSKLHNRIIGKDPKGRTTVFGWNWKEYIYLFIFLGLGMLLGLKQNLDFVTASVTEQCNRYIIDKYGWNEDLQIYDPYLLKEQGFYENKIVFNISKTEYEK